MGNAGENNAGGLHHAQHRDADTRDLGPYFLSGTLVHESVESYFDIAEGIRDMGTRHADYVAQWFTGKFAAGTACAALLRCAGPLLAAQDDSAYGLRYDEWLQTEDGRLYLGNPANCDLRTIDRRGHAWAPSDWLAEQGGFWVWGREPHVTPVPNPLGLAPALLLAADLERACGIAAPYSQAIRSGHQGRRWRERCQSRHRGPGPPGRGYAGQARHATRRPRPPRESRGRRARGR